MPIDSPNHSAKIALVSTSLGRVLRGFESFTESLFQSLRNQVPELQVTLFQGGGQSGEHRVLVPNFHHQDLPARWLGWERAALVEQRSFALSLYPKLRRGRYDIIHYNELVMGSALFHLRRTFGGKFKLLYCNGAPSPPVHYHHRCDFAQMLTGPMYETARSFGLLPERLFLVPYGVDALRFSPQAKNNRLQIRQKLGIPEKAKVVFTAAALKREHKRIDYVIKEVANLEETVWLLAAGQRTEDTPFLESQAEKLLPGRWRFISWPHSSVHLLYGAADVFVLASLAEAFGLVTVEALLSGLPVVVHDTPQNRWILDGQPSGLIDMSQEGNLAVHLRNFFSLHIPVSSPVKTAERFSWERLIPQYNSMYQKIGQSKIRI